MIKQFAKSVAPRFLWTTLAAARFALSSKGTRYREDIWALGLFSATALSFPRCEARAGRPPSETEPPLRRLWIKGYESPLYYREGTSDREVIRQVFSQRQYRCLAQKEDVSLIVDCGANIGCTSLFFLYLYPNAHLIAVEPDSGNFAICEQNLQPFSHRVTLVNSGVWSVASPMRVERQKFRDGMEWSYQIRPTLDGETPEFMSTTIDALVENSAYRTIDILKIDIEAAERELFRSGFDTWLSRTRHLAIELHDEECERIFNDAMSQYTWRPSLMGDLVVCHDIRRLERDESLSVSGAISRNTPDEVE